MKKINTIFLTIADTVSYAMGTPGNIIFWLIVVGIWFHYGPVIAKSHFMPAWFTSNPFNFPLNTVTTLVEMFVGFLVAASANRIARLNKELMEKQNQLIEKIINLENQLLQEEITIEKEIVQTPSIDINQQHIISTV